MGDDGADDNNDITTCIFLESRRDEPSSPAKAAKVKVSRLGSPTRHNPVTFTKAGECIFCCGLITTGCSHPMCGHMHRGNCWKKAHSNDAKVRAKLKKKRVQPEIAGGARPITTRLKTKHTRRRPAAANGRLFDDVDADEA